MYCAKKQFFKNSPCSVRTKWKNISPRNRREDRVGMIKISLIIKPGVMRRRRDRFRRKYRNGK